METMAFRQEIKDFFSWNILELIIMLSSNTLCCQALQVTKIFHEFLVGTKNAKQASC